MTEQIDKIIITGDILRPDKKIFGNQNPNITWFYNLFEFFINKIVKNVTVQKIIAVPKNDGFDVEKFYRFYDLEMSIENWIRLYDYTQINVEAENYFSKYFENSIVIGFELPKIFKKIMERKNIFYIEFITHPIRFLDDIFFGIYSNHEKINEILSTLTLSDEDIYALANLRKAGLKRKWDLGIEDNSALIIGQTRVDRSLIEKGQLLVMNNYRDKLEEISKNHNKIYFKPHPYEARNKEVQSLLKDLKAEFINKNIYHLICQNAIDSVYAISSSVIEEAKYFGKKAEYLCDTVPGTHYPIFNDYFYSSFWKEILKVFFPINEQFNIKIPDKPNRLRDNLGWYWGYHIFEFDSVYDDIKRQNRKLILFRLNKLISCFFPKN